MKDLSTIKLYAQIRVDLEERSEFLWYGGLHPKASDVCKLYSMLKWVLVMNDAFCGVAMILPMLETGARYVRPFRTCLYIYTRTYLRLFLLSLSLSLSLFLSPSLVFLFHAPCLTWMERHVLGYSSTIHKLHASTARMKSEKIRHKRRNIIENLSLKPIKYSSVQVVFLSHWNVVSIIAIKSFHAPCWRVPPTTICTWALQRWRNHAGNVYGYSHSYRQRLVWLLCLCPRYTSSGFFKISRKSSHECK